jgi:hypothetical protein
MKYQFCLKDNECIAVDFISRNKDNINVENFSQRAEVFIFDGTLDQLQKRFENFVKNGKQGELSRLYISLNPRNKDKIKAYLISDLALDQNLNICKLNAKLTSISMNADCKTTKYWLWDFDADQVFLEEFIQDCLQIDPNLEITAYDTVNGYAVVTSGFDTREIVKKWNNFASNKKDGHILIDWARNE